MTPIEPCLSATQVATLLGKRRAWVLAAAHDGTLPVLRWELDQRATLGKRPVFARQTIAAYLDHMGRIAAERGAA